MVGGLIVPEEDTQGIRERERDIYIDIHSSGRDRTWGKRQSSSYASKREHIQVGGMRCSCDTYT
jgi:hypothetical protein